MRPPDPRAPHLCLFNTERFYSLRPEAHPGYTRVDHLDSGRLVGTLAGFRGGTTFESGHLAPFGGIDLVRESASPTVALELIRGVGEQLRRDGVRSVSLRLKSRAYGRGEEAVQFALFNSGYRVERCEISHHIDLSHIRSGDDYLRSLKPPSRRALGHLLKDDLSFAEASTESDWATAYSVIDANRRAKKYYLRLPLEYVLRIRDAFPGLVRAFALSHREVAVAAALVYAVTPRTHQVIYWGDRPSEERHRSPMNLLALRLVEVALGSGAQVLDLGTSSLDGVPNQGLIQFKQSVGAAGTLRFDVTASL